MTREEIKDKVVSTACQMLGTTSDKVTSKSRFVEDLGADSLDQVEIIMALEEAFDISIADEQLENIKTIDDAVDMIETQITKTQE